MSEYTWKPFTLLVSAEEVKGNEMTKFNVGDKVKSLVNEADVRKGAVYQIVFLDDEGVIWVNDDKGDRWYLSKDEYVSVDDSGPIRTVTHRQIVPGVYGKVCVNEKGDGTGLDYIQMLPSIDATELREAAHILNQIAEVLEENGE